MAWPRPPKLFSSGSIYVSVPTPSVLSLTHAPSLKAPSELSLHGVICSSRLLSSRITPRDSSDSPFSSTSSVRCCASLISVPFTATIISPGFRPASAAGLFPETSIKPTTRAPFVYSITPIDSPPATKSFSSALVTVISFTGIPNSFTVNFASPSPLEEIVTLSEREYVTSSRVSPLRAIASAVSSDALRERGSSVRSSVSFPLCRYTCSGNFKISKAHASAAANITAASIDAAVLKPDLFFCKIKHLAQFRCKV